MTALVIDDNPGIRTMVEDTLQGAGYKVVTAANGREGLRKFQEGQFDLVILDIFMPVQDGVETLTQIMSTSPMTKVLAISGGAGLGFPHALEWAERLGARRTLNKPFTPEELVAAVAQLLGNS